MPSKAFELMATWFRDTGNGDSDLAVERTQAAEYGRRYQPALGVVDETVTSLRPGSYLMTPDRPRDDLVILYIHGGGFRSGNAAALRSLGAHVAAGARARVVLPEYRLAPEERFPAAIEDCVVAFDHAATLAPNVVVAGESAGANLAAAVLLERRDRALAGVLHSGVFDLRPERFHTGSWVDRSDTELVLRKTSGLQMYADYLGGHPADDPRVSPVLADLHGLPPLLIQVSSAERLLDDSLALATRAARAGVHVELEVWPHMFHSWPVAAGFLPEATEAAGRTGAFIDRVAAGRVVDGAALTSGPAGRTGM